METNNTIEGKQLVFSPHRGFFSRLFFPLPKNSINVYDLFSRPAKKIWRQAGDSSEKLFLELLKEKSVKKILARLGVSNKDAEKFLQSYLKLKNSPYTSLDKVPFEAFSLAVKLHGHNINCLMLLGALLKHLPKDHVVQALFDHTGLTLENLELCIVWTHDLNYEFTPNSREFKILYCCRQAKYLEEHFGYNFELPAIEAAVEFSHKQTLKDLEHKKALQILVKAGGLAKQQKSKWVSKALAKQAA